MLAAMVLVGHPHDFPWLLAALALVRSTAAHGAKAIIEKHRRTAVGGIRTVWRACSGMAVRSTDGRSGSETARRRPP